MTSSSNRYGRCVILLIAVALCCIETALSFNCLTSSSSSAAWGDILQRQPNQLIRCMSQAEVDVAPAGNMMVEEAKGAAELVTSLLKKIADTERGIKVSGEAKMEIDTTIEQLCVLGENADWLDDPNVFGNYNVAYVSAGKSENANPAGGRYRGKIGRAVFRTTNLFQHLAKPNLAVNMVQFKLLGLLPGCVTLKGVFEREDSRKNFVKVMFEPPRVTFGKGKASATIKIGPTSSVLISAAYVDERIRLGKGGRGSLFVFTRGGAASTADADLWKAYTSSASINAKIAAVVFSALSAAVGWQVSRLYAVPFAVIAAGLFLSRGGIAD